MDRDGTESDGCERLEYGKTGRRRDIVAKALKRIDSLGS